MARILVVMMVVLSTLGCAAAPRLVDEDPATGFALYRSGQLSGSELTELCRHGVDELVVLDGGAARRECRMLADRCPEMRVRYSHLQDPKRPMSQEFLQAFGEWIEEGRSSGRKLAYRCRHGWHRAGRLTAYYQMRFMGVGVEEAIGEMQARGRFMWRHPQLDPQVEALGQVLTGEPCSGGVEHCPQRVEATSEGLEADGSLLRDACTGIAEPEVAR